MGKILIIGAGGVGNVVAQKCAQNSNVFSEIVLASRTRSKCDAIATEVKKRQGIEIKTNSVDADNPAEVVELIKRYQPELVLNVALPYQDLAIMDACLETKVNYLDTANYEPKDVAHFEYSWQWAYQDRFEKAGIMALLGSGFDPGVTNVFCAHAQKHLFNRMRTIDILDCNAGNHGKAFATNFNPEINIREVTQPVRHYQSGEWVETPAVIRPGAIHMPFDYPAVGIHDSYLLYHEELESLARHFPKVETLRFWMTFSQNYLTHLRVLEAVGMTRIDPVHYHGQDIIPLQFLKAVLPEPASLAENYSGKTAIGCVIEGEKDGANTRKYVYNVCDHAACYEEVGSQAISYTTGVPAVIGAMLMMNGTWNKPGVWNIEQLNPDPFMHQLPKQGLPWQVIDFKKSIQLL